jgi:hypothetical protein
MLSVRGAKSAASQDIPWRFAPGGNNRYDAVTNPTGVISFATAENVRTRATHDLNLLLTQIQQTGSCPRGAVSICQTKRKLPCNILHHLSHICPGHNTEAGVCVPL